MINLLRTGTYKLLSTQRHGTVICLGEAAYDWRPPDGSDITRIGYRELPEDTVLRSGTYRYYKVQNEPELTDTYHLELETGKGPWEGYFLEDGLPDKGRKSRITPTHEVISGAHKLWPSYDLANGKAVVKALGLDINYR